MSWVMDGAPLRAMRTTPTIATTASSEKRVRFDFSMLPLWLPMANNLATVYVSSVVIEEIKQIVKLSEIMKYVKPVDLPLPRVGAFARLLDPNL